MPMLDPYRLPFGVRKKLLEGLLRLRALTPSAMARHARDTTPFFRRFYANRDLDDFTALPVLEKRLVRDVDPYDLLSEPYRDKVLYYGETTGSTGSPTPVFYTPEEFGLSRRLGLVSTQFQALRGLLAGNRACVNGMSFGFTIAGASFSALFEEAGGLVANVGSRSTLATPPRIARAIARLRPVAIAAAPIDLLAWMRLLREDHPAAEAGARQALKMVVSSAELCARSRSQRIQEHFGVAHLDVYACVEGFFALPCTCRERHVLPAYHLELLDDRLGPLPAHGTGRLAFTDLVKRSSPLVRYLLDDWVTLRPSTCPHGFGLSITPHGRTELNVELSGETCNVEHFEEALFTHGLFGDYRIELYPDRMEVRAEEYAPALDPPSAVEDHLRERFGVPARVVYVPFGEITDYRQPRSRKPILKIDDRRPTSRQQRPEFL